VSFDPNRGRPAAVRINKVGWDDGCRPIAAVAPWWPPSSKLDMICIAHCLWHDTLRLSTTWSPKGSGWRTTRSRLSGTATANAFGGAIMFRRRCRQARRRARGDMFSVRFDVRSPSRFIDLKAFHCDGVATLGKCLSSPASPRGSRRKEPSTGHHSRCGRLVSRLATRRTARYLAWRLALPRDALDRESHSPKTQGAPLSRSV
jgi:hypothetical protein